MEEISLCNKRNGRSCCPTLNKNIFGKYIITTDDGRFIILKKKELKLLCETAKKLGCC